MVTLNFDCIACNTNFTADVGAVSFSFFTKRPKFEKDIICPRCGVRTIDEVLLTEEGQGQLTEIFMHR